MGINEAKAIWQRLQVEINTAHTEVSNRQRSSIRPDSFYNYLCAHHENTNHFRPIRSEVKIGYYGKVIVAELLFAENGFLYTETAYYPTAPFHWGKRLSVDNIDTYSNHYMERLIERKNITTLTELKNEITTRQNMFDATCFTRTEGGLNIDTEYLIVYRDMVVFCNSELCNGIAKSVRKTLITDKEFKGEQSNIIDYVLNEFGTDACLLTTHEIPRTLAQAKNVIEDTKQRLSVGSQFEIITKKPFPTGRHADKKFIKQFVKYLEHYDPTIR
tara:strand:- start:1395 stop:2213 length:819 start_codon:yes stop_codon:yes gene_type:complete